MSLKTLDLNFSGETIMKSILVALFMALNMAYASTSIKELTVENLIIKYDSNEWEYKFLKIPDKGFPSFFENKKVKLKLIIEREIVHENEGSMDSILNAKCAEADHLHQQDGAGFAKIETINGVKTCYVKYKTMAGSMIRKFIILESDMLKNNEIYTYTWTSASLKSKDRVTKFLSGFIK